MCLACCCSVLVCRGQGELIQLPRRRGPAQVRRESRRALPTTTMELAAPRVQSSCRIGPGPKGVVSRPAPAAARRARHAVAAPRSCNNGRRRAGDGCVRGWIVVAARPDGDADEFGNRRRDPGASGHVELVVHLRDLVHCVRRLERYAGALRVGEYRGSADVYVHDLVSGSRWRGDDQRHGPCVVPPAGPSRPTELRCSERDRSPDLGVAERH